MNTGCGLEPEQIGKVLDSLVGSIAPQGDTALDSIAMQNMKAFEGVCDWVSRKLELAQHYVDSSYGSVSMVANATMTAADDLAVLFEMENGRFECCDCPVKEKMEREETDNGL